VLWWLENYGQRCLVYEARERPPRYSRLVSVPDRGAIAWMGKRREVWQAEATQR